ncbi:MAG: hypothetical protein HY791_29265 [Deltaproteobacteria bacterium]|nr:hypothetical protein [Deltaproteobacteria bacterium]
MDRRDRFGIELQRTIKDTYTRGLKVKAHPLYLVPQLRLRLRADAVESPTLRDDLGPPDAALLEVPAAGKSGGLHAAHVYVRKLSSLTRGDLVTGEWARPGLRVIDAL